MDIIRLCTLRFALCALHGFAHKIRDDHKIGDLTTNAGMAGNTRWIREWKSPY